jgi:uncharacterized protein (DUF1778 family)
MNIEERDRLRQELDALKDTGHELDGFTRVQARISKTPRAVISFRAADSELQEMVDAAKALDRNLSEFIREAALKEARQVRAGINEARELALAKQAKGRT